jgi:hypothetical protein
VLEGAARERARLDGVAGSGTLVQRGNRPDEVLLATWSGASADEIAGLLGTLEVRAERPVAEDR